MAIFDLSNPWVFTFGILGNLISLMVYLSPVPTFYRVFKKKSTEGFQSVPYVVALFSAMLWIYYAFLKKDANLLITINSLGCVIEMIYIVMYIIYAPKKAKIQTIKFMLLLNVVVFCSIVLFTLLLAHGTNRVLVTGWICVAFAVSVFAAPLSIMRQVIRTKSVEFMPFYLSFFLMLSAIVWFSYGLSLRDMYIATPNILGFLFGVAQMVLYAIYRRNKNSIPVTDQEKDGHKEIDLMENVVKVQVIDPPLVVINPTTTTTNQGNHQKATAGAEEEKNVGGLNNQEDLESKV